MSLFRRECDKSRVKFHCLELSDTELKGITKLIEENGGEVGDNTEFPVKFIPRQKYSSGIYPSFRLYDVEFIRTCVKQSRIVDPKPFRLGPERLGENCMISYFLRGHCYYERILSTIKVNGSSIVLDSSLSSVKEDSEDDTPLAARINDRSPDMFRSRLVVRRLRDKIPQDPAGQQSVENGGVPVDQSQSVVSNTYLRRLLTSDNGRASTADNRDDEPSNFEHEFVCQTHFPERLPTTTSLSTTDASYKTATDFVQVKVEATDSIDWQFTPNCSLESLTGNTKETWRAVPPHPLPDMPRPQNSPEADTVNTSSSGDTTISIWPISSPHQSPRVPRIKLEECAIPPSPSRTSKCNEIYLRLREITETRRCLSSDTSNATSRVHPIAKHMQSDYGKVSPLRTNATTINNPKSPSSTRVRNPKYRPGAGILQKTKHTALIAEPLTSARPNSLKNDNEWNMPGTSGLHFRKQSVHHIVSGSSSDNEEVRGPILVRNSIRFRRSIEESTDSNGSGNEAKSKVNPGSYEFHKRRTYLNVHKAKKGPTPDFVEETDSSIKTNSEEEAAKAPTKTRKHRVVQNRLGNARENEILSDSESDKDASRFVRKKTVETSQGLVPSRKNAKRNWPETSSDEDKEAINNSFRKRKQYYASLEYDKREKAIQYARSWRSRMLADRPKKLEQTHLNFTKHEQKLMVDFLLTYDDVRKVRPKGLKIWHQMIKRGHLQHRTPQSLQNHFVKYLLRNISDYFSRMSEEQQQQFKDLQRTNRDRKK